MKKTIFFLCVVSHFCFAQNLIDVAELTIKINPLSSKELYYAFAEGDQIIFSFQEIEQKKLNKFEILEYPTSSKFMEYEIEKIENKVINVLTKGVYTFRIKNSNIFSRRICKVKIQRIAASEATKNFSSSTKWLTEQDTVWKSYTKKILVGHDTIYRQKTKELAWSSEKIEEMVLDKTERVHSRTNSNRNKTTVFFKLPENIENDHEHRKVIAWAYWVGVGEESNEAWRQNKEIIAGAIQGVASLTLSPLGAIAIGTATSLALPKMGEDVIYGVVDEANKALFLSGQSYTKHDFGKGVAAFKRFTDSNLMQGKYYIVLENDNIMQGIDVNVKVSVIIEHKKNNTKPATMRIKPRYEKKIITQPTIKTRKFPAPVDYISKK